MAEGGIRAALGFVEDLESAYRHIGSHPASGSLRYAHELNLPDVRCWQLRRFPYLLFYTERADRIDLLRVLHARRDVPHWMAQSE